ncbi:hypothetical protein N7456_002124 [Penicillium angulare]|uniref:DUF3824 domain-containing protein n=1 Tax=Penicillium angulare TaxID=116970 RepID=A0A9W9G7J3_9EURO|nr:hypothetical protein N7456_002124 [Penicillium angulare]
MAYYDRRSYAPRDRRSGGGGAVEYYEDPRYRYERDLYPVDSVEEIPRDFPPGERYVYERGYDSRRPRRPAYEGMRRSSSVSGHDPYYDGYYRSSRPRRSRPDDRYAPRRSKYDSPSPSPSPVRHRRRKSLSEHGSSRYSSDRGRGRGSSRHRRRSSSSRSRSRSRDRDGKKSRNRSEQRIAQAARAALTAGAVEAFRSRKDPGEWTGEKGKRILTAAVTAAGTDGLVDRDPNKHSKRHVVESTLAGLAANHFMNGSRSRSQSRNGRGRKSSSGGGIKDLAASGALAAAGKEIYDRISRSRSRPARGRDDSRDRDSDDDRRGSTKKRSKSVSDYLNKGMAALGIGAEGEKESRDSRDRGDRGDRRRSHRDRDRDRDSRYDNHSDSYSDSDGYSDDHRGSSSRDIRPSRDGRDRDRNRDRERGSRDVGRYRSLNGRNPNPPSPYMNRRSLSGAPSRNDARSKSGNQSHSSSECDSDLGDSSDEKEKHKKMKRDMLVTGGLATVATIHAAHNVYGGIEKRKKRQEQLKEGEITAEEAHKRKIKANTLDAVSVGLAALGIKGAYGEWKEVNEKRKEHQHFQKECEERARKRMLKRSRSQGPSSRHRWPDEIECAPSRNGSFSPSASRQAQISY